MHIHNDPDDLEYHKAMKLQTRQISDEQLHKFEGYASEIFSAFGLDLDRPATKDTPRRFIKALFDATEGYDGDPKLLRVFDTECRGEPDCRLSQVIEGPIPFYALCEHHALPYPGMNSWNSKNSLPCTIEEIRFKSGAILRECSTLVGQHPPPQAFITPES